MTALQSLTPLRGVAALFVVFHHYSAYLLPELGEAVGMYTQIWLNSYLWVDFFFLLSGFLLTHVYAQQFRGEVLSGFPKFLLARFARLYPLHIFMLMLFVGFELLCMVLLIVWPVPEGGGLSYTPFTDKHSVPALLANVLLLQGVVQGTSWNQPSWSISAEWFVYLLFPFLASKLELKHVAGSVVTYILLLLGLYSLIELSGGHLDLFGWPAIVRALLEFMMGKVLYDFYRRSGQVKLLESSFFLGVVICLTFFILHINVHDILVIPFLSLLILASVQCKGWVADSVNSRPLNWLGEISYSVYMVHWFLFIVITRLWLHFTQTRFAEGLSLLESFAVLGLSVAILLILSALTYTHIEVPSRLRIRNSKTLAKLFNTPTQ